MIIFLSTNPQQTHFTSSNVINVINYIDSMNVFFSQTGSWTNSCHDRQQQILTDQPLFRFAKTLLLTVIHISLL